MSPSRAPVFSCAHYFQAPATQATATPAKKRREDIATGGGGGDYLSEAIIFNFSVKGRRLFEGGDYSREAINRGTAIIQGNTFLPWSLTSSYH